MPDEEDEWAVSLDDPAEEEPRELEPGEVSLEHAAFVLLGAGVTLFTVALVLL